MKTGIDLIAEERHRQVESEGWTAEHDDGHDRGQIAVAALNYLMFVCDNRRFGDDVTYRWPWSGAWWKPSDSNIRNLVKAGALIAAEIDRIQRLELCEQCAVD